jgi:dienelactone hydrolase
MLAVMLMTLLCGGPCTRTADSALVWRYDARAGDHLVYRETMRQEIDGRVVFGLGTARDKPFGTPFTAAGSYEWTSHVLVMRAAQDRLLLGVQRNRSRDDSVSASLDDAGHAPAHDTVLASRMHSRERFAQANEMSVSGDATFPWAARREMRSKLLWDVFEMPSLPQTAVQVGSRWQGTDPFAFEMRVAAIDTLGGSACARAEGAASVAALIPRGDAAVDSVRLRYWYCPATHTVRRIELDGTYPDAAFHRIHETVTLELTAIRRGESVSQWMASAELRQGALVAAAIADSATIASLLATPGVDTILSGGDTASARLLLGIRYRSGAPPPPVPVLATLLASDNPRVRAVAARELLLAKDPSSGALLARAAADSDYFVRQAAARDASAPRPSAIACARPDSGARSGAMAHAALPPGTSFRGMESAPYRGWPYGMYIPDDYRGDERFPLIIYLAGNSGPAIEGVQLGSPAFERTGYLVVYPNGYGGWWRSGTETMVDSLVSEVMRRYAVDPERIYISGLSNGGTGTFDYVSLWPQRFSAAVVAMGAGLFGFTEAGGDRPFVSNTTHVPMLFLHGKKDPVIPVSATVHTVDSLRAQHADVQMRLFPDREHEIIPGFGDDGATVDFFEHHSGRAMPRNLAFAAATTAHARHYWLEVLEKEEVPGTVAMKGGDGAEDAVRAQLGALVHVEVRASIDDHDTIHLDTQHVRKLRLLLRPDLFTRAGDVKVVLNGKTVFSGPVPYDCAVYARSWAASHDPYLAYSAELTLDVTR